MAPRPTQRQPEKIFFLSLEPSILRYLKRKENLAWPLMGVLLGEFPWQLGLSPLFPWGNLRVFTQKVLKQTQIGDLVKILYT